MRWATSLFNEWKYKNRVFHQNIQTESSLSIYSPVLTTYSMPIQGFLSCYQTLLLDLSPILFPWLAVIFTAFRPRPLLMWSTKNMAKTNGKLWCEGFELQQRSYLSWDVFSTDGRRATQLKLIVSLANRIVIKFNNNFIILNLGLFS